MICHITLMHFCHPCDCSLVTELEVGGHRLPASSAAICAQLLRLFLLALFKPKMKKRGTEPFVTEEISPTCCHMTCLKLILSIAALK